ncbi:hypothetical protein HDU87_008560 [Geranomyces variabilis]|uniref:Uncharacterized protein n=1 Tax=Geranomyces variabilis TaxID=109894 RepID=A0AAD5TRL9_9FUNG|nr:hypothetical protein HDU87_008560 [Geranomyces variabilis]
MSTHGSPVSTMFSLLRINNGRFFSDIQIFLQVLSITPLEDPRQSEPRSTVSGTIVVMAVSRLLAASSVILELCHIGGDVPQAKNPKNPLQRAPPDPHAEVVWYETVWTHPRGCATPQTLAAGTHDFAFSIPVPAGWVGMAVARPHYALRARLLRRPLNIPDVVSLPTALELLEGEPEQADGAPPSFAAATGGDGSAAGSRAQLQRERLLAQAQEDVRQREIEYIRFAGMSTGM